MITIRRATPADAAQLQRISEGASAYGGTLQLPYSSVELWTERLRQSSGDDIVLVAVDGEVVVGSAGLHPEKKRRRLHVAMLGITVAESHTGRGIGSLLMAELMRLADQGRIKEGNSADFVLCDGDPLADIKRAARKENHRLVVKRGQVARDNRAAFIPAARRVAAE